MPTSPCLDVHFATHAIIKWESDKTTHVLAKPDPKVSSITLMAHFNSTNALFELHIPIKLKGLNNTSDITLRACASSIISLDLVKNPTVTAEVEQELESTALGLRFELNCQLDILVPTPVIEPICPGGRARSGLILDAVREFTRATTFSVYIEARDAPPTLQSISDAVNQGLFKSYRSSRFQLASMYAGLGAKIVRLDADNTLMPPSYQETEPPPPPPPIDDKPDRKRHRQDTQTERADDIALIWAALQSLQQAKDTDIRRITALEMENQKLRQDLDKLQDGYAALKLSHQDLSFSFGALETTVEKNTEEHEESVNNELEEIREDVKKLDNQFCFIQEGQVSAESVAKIKDALLQDISSRLSAG
jgi:translation elongation factor EF-1beta